MMCPELLQKYEGNQEQLIALGGRHAFSGAYTREGRRNYKKVWIRWTGGWRGGNAGREADHG